MDKVKVTEYNNIDFIEVTNFMVYSHAKIVFDESNIINLKGYNSSGKSAMLKAIVSCLLNMYPKAQTKFIRHGEDYFRIVMRFKDGITILKDRYIGGQSLYEVYRGEECIFTTKVGNKLTKVDTVPQVIQDYLGLCVVSTGCLNYQVRNDPLWLIDTTGGDNYNSLNEILKTEEISKANSLLNSDRNKLSSEITGIEASLQEVKLSLIEAKGYTEGLLLLMKERENICKELSHKYRDLKTIISLFEEIGSIIDIPYIGKVPEDRVLAIDTIHDLAEQQMGIIDYPNIEKCNYDRLSDILDILDIANDLNSTSSCDMPKVNQIDSDRFSNISELCGILIDVKDTLSIIDSCDSEYSRVSSELEAVVKRAEERGTKFIRCENCGRYMEISD